MSSIRSFSACALCTGFAVFLLGSLVTATALPAQESPHPASGPPDLSVVVGIYAAEGPHHRVVISPRRLGERTVPVFTSLGTGAIRALFPGEDGELVAGESLTRPEPVAFRVVFGGAETLTLHEVASGAAWKATKLPLREEEVELRGEGGSALRGTLHLPGSGAGPFPAVALAGGSEDAGDRHAFDALPYVLAERGFAVLAYDKRGTGASEGSWDVEHEVLAADLAAAVEFLADRDEVGETVGVIGFSEGSWIAPLAATQTDGVGFIVALSGGGLPKAESFLHRERGELEEQGLQGDALEEAMDSRRVRVEEARERVAAGEGAKPWDLRMTHDPAAEWRRFRGPVLALFGAWDTIVPPEASAERLRRVLAEAHHPDFRVVVFPRAHHSLFLGRTGAPSEFARMEGLGAYVPGYWETLLLWLDRVGNP